MGNQFWWFYDALTLATLIVLIYSSAKKGFSRTFFIMIGYIISITVAYSISDSVSNTIYKNAIQQSNLKKIESSIENLDLGVKYKTYIDSLGYNIRMDSDNINAVLKENPDSAEALYSYCNLIKGKDVDEFESFKDNMYTGLGSIVYECLSSNLSEYNIKLLYENINDENFSEFINIIINETNQAKAEYIEQNFTRESSLYIIKKVIGLICFFVFMLVFRLIIEKLFADKEIMSNLGITNNIIGGILGIIEAFIIMLVIVNIIKILVDIGNDNMLIFNTDTIENSIIFKYIYNLKYIN